MEGITKKEPADPPYRPVQPPPDVRRHLLGLRARQQHAEVERPQILALGDPPFPLDQLPVHDGDLTSRPPEVDETKLHPEPEGFPEPDRLDLHPLLRHLGLHSISIRLVNNIVYGNHGYIRSQGVERFRATTWTGRAKVYSRRETHPRQSEPARVMLPAQESDVRSSSRTRSSGLENMGQWENSTNHQVGPATPRNTGSPAAIISPEPAKAYRGLGQQA